MQRALHFQSIIFQIPAEAQTSQTHAFAHVANASSSRVAKMPVQKNKRSPQKSSQPCSKR